MPGLGVYWALAAVLLAPLALYYPSVEWLAREWYDGSDSFSHGFMIAGISAVLIFRARHAVRDADTAFAWLALPVLVLGSIAWMLAHVAHVAALHTAAVPFLMLTAVAAVFGRRAAIRLAFPILYLLLAMPIWSLLQVPLQAMTVLAVERLIGLAGIPVFFDGSFVNLRAGTLEIAHGCAGLNFVLTAMSISLLYSYLFLQGLRRHLLLFAAATGVAIVSNWIRVSLVVWIAHSSDMQSAMVEDHATLGWILFGIVMIPVLLFARRLEDQQGNRKTGKRPDRKQAAAEPVAALPAGAGRTWIVALLAIAIAGIGPAWARTLDATADTTPPAFDLPSAAAGWEGPSANASSPWQPEFAGATVEAAGRYLRGQREVFAYANYYARQAQDRELIYFANSVAGSLRERDSDVVAVSGPAGRDVTLRESLATGGGNTWLIWSWYTVNERRLTSAVQVKLYQALGAVVGKPGAGLVAVAARCEDGCEGARQNLSLFMEDNPEFLRLGSMAPAPSSVMQPDGG